MKPSVKEARDDAMLQGIGACQREHNRELPLLSPEQLPCQEQKSAGHFATAGGESPGHWQPPELQNPERPQKPATTTEPAFGRGPPQQAPEPGQPQKPATTSELALEMSF